MTEKKRAQSAPSFCWSEAVRKGSEGMKQCVGHYAENENGKTVTPKASTTVAVCAVGAIRRACNWTPLWHETDIRNWIYEMNDGLKMSFEEIAIELEEAEKAGVI